MSAVYSHTEGQLEAVAIFGGGEEETGKEWPSCMLSLREDGCISSPQNLRPPGVG